MAAAKKIASVAPAMRQAVLRFVVESGERGATADEIQTALTMRPQTCTPRCNELRRDRLIKRNGQRRATCSGSTAFVYVATAKGIREVAG